MGNRYVYHQQLLRNLAFRENSRRNILALRISIVSVLSCSNSTIVELGASVLIATLSRQLWLHLNKISHLHSEILHGLSPRANYIDRATSACRRSDCQLLRIEGATWSA
jgi:hypothetical protein